MREIKFRAWLPKGYFVDKEICKMDYKVCVSYDGKLMELEGGWDYHGDSDEAILMQYIGLKDKNGVEIYEGDIVHTVSESDNGWKYRKYDEKQEVKWSDEEGCWAVDYEPLYTSLERENVEVIGNIYENPELLK